MLLLKVLFLFQSSFAAVAPTGVNDDKLDLVINSFSTTYSGALAKPSYALGTQAAISLSSAFLDLSELSKVSSSNISSSILINQLNISKGLYSNFDLGLSAVLPIESNKSISGFGGYISWLTIKRGFTFKPTAYLYSLNVDNVINSFNSGLSLSLFKKVSFLKLGAHFIVESSEVDIIAQRNGTSIFVSGDEKEGEKFYSVAGLSLALEMKNFDVIVQPLYNFDADLFVNAKLVFNL